MTQLGGHAHFLDSDATQISHGETPEDTGKILSSMGHGICIRHDLVLNEGNKYMRAMAEASNVPIINMQCDVDHPTQTLADIMTIREKFGTNLKGLKIAVSWAFAPSYAKPLSVPQGLITLMTRFGMDVSLAHPPGYKLIDRTVESAKANAAKSGGKFEIVDDMDDAFKDADIVYPEELGRVRPHARPPASEDKRRSRREPKSVPRDQREVQELDLRRKPHEDRQEVGRLHALPARRPRLRSNRRRHRRPAIDRLPRSRKPPAHRQSHHGLHDARTAVLIILTTKTRRTRRKNDSYEVRCFDCPNSSSCPPCLRG